MASEEVTLGVGIEADASDAVRDMRQAADAAASLADSFREIASVAVTAARALSRVEQGVTGTARSGRQAGAAIQSNTTAMREQAKAANELANSLNAVSQVRNQGNIHTPGTGSTRVSTASPTGRPDIGVGVDVQSRESINATNAAREQAIKIRQREQQAIRETVLANIAENRSWRESIGVKQQLGNSAAEVAARMQNYVYAARDAGQASGEMQDRMFGARYALLDISTAAGIAGAALIAMNSAVVASAATYEDAMAAIQRTTGATESQVADIQDQFVELAQSVPVGFDNLAQIGELAGQLNIPTERLAAFTETVAQFTSTTDVATQASAEAFGRLDTLLPDVQGNYNALGSAILNVGVNSVATESAIISTTTQIAAAGAQAGFTADEVIGLAASFASLGIAPEAARGSAIRIFSELRTAALEGGDALDTFASLAGQSASEFQQAWLNGNSSQAFLDFLRGLQEEGANAETTLQQLGITGVRDINALLRLSQNLDIVQQSFGYANDGFTEGTQLAEAFGITAETLNSRVQVLGQAFQAFLAVIGEGGTGPLKEFVNFLVDTLKIMTDIATNPAAQWLAIFGGIFTLLAGGVLILTALAARMGSAAIAARTVNIELTQMAARAAASGTAIGALEARLLGAGIAATRFTTILKGIGWGTLITAGISAALLAIDLIGNAFESNADKAKAAFGDLTGLSSALRKDTEEVADGQQQALGTVSGSLTTVRETTSGWASAMNDALGVQTSLAGATQTTSDTIDNQTLSIGKNTAAWLAQKLANDQAIKDMFTNNERLAGVGAEANLEGLLTAATRNDVTAAKAIVEEYRTYVESIRSGVTNFGSDALDAQVLVYATQQLTAMENALGTTTGALAEAAATNTITETTYRALGVSMTEVGDEANGMADEVATAASTLSSLRGAVENAFGNLNVMGQFSSDLVNLFQGMAESGIYAFDALTQAGYTNLQNLQAAIATSIAAGEQMGLSATESVAALFIQLQKMGIDTANLLASLANIPGIGRGGAKEIAGYLDGTKSLSRNATQLTNAMGGVASSATKAARSLGGGGGGGGRGGGGLGGAAKNAAKEVRTLVDYANDLRGVLQRAFDIRFGSQQAMDKITAQWQDIRDAVDDANKKIAEAQRRMAELSTENNTLTYFLSVAVNYGDSLRAAEIQDQIAKNNAEIAEEQSKVSEASGALDRSLNGNSQAAIKNRESLTELASSYQSLIEEYASAGMSQDELKAKTEQLRAQFIAQGLQLGYSRSELETYAAAFDDVKIAIDRIPRNITVSANISPALQALAEFEARAAAAGRNASGSIGSGGGRGYGIGGISLPDMSGLGDQAARQFKFGWNRQTQTWQTRDQTTGAWVRTGVNLFREGGYTGGANPGAIAGLVHGQEYVINAKNTARLGLPFLNALNNGRTPMAATPVSAGIQVVELSSYDRALLAQAGNVQLNIDGRAVATAANAANFVSAKRGSN